MGNLVIKDFPDEVKRRMRVEALGRGIGLRELVLEKFGGRTNGQSAGSGAVESDWGKEMGAGARRKVRAAAGRGSKPIGVPAEGRTYASVSADVCASCEHERIRHHGFGSACQADNCRCGAFEDGPVDVGGSLA